MTFPKGESANRRQVPMQGASSTNRCIYRLYKTGPKKSYLQRYKNHLQGYKNIRREELVSVTGTVPNDQVQGCRAFFYDPLSTPDEMMPCRIFEFKSGISPPEPPGYCK